MASVGSWPPAPKKLELRTAKRRRVALLAKIVTGTETMVHCEVQDLSTEGAKIAVREHVALPETFQIYVAAHTLQVFSARLCWRKGDFAGLAFGSNEERPSQGSSEARPEPALPKPSVLMLTHRKVPAEDVRYGTSTVAREVAKSLLVDRAASVAIGRYGHERRRRAVR
ncbi:PilZ domain-containing protein [Microvirga puerhi]|uniref:PilZ domain-containing protein n=1 Tax=Microvirga puerhi TaxID=2876078 RepID=A0ABS7VN62_9HYPH|nr:PilZ domain-containing protein [Microvirga puerhi]MBZ6076956.1 PilZ domain-containing protein [Microvirga puerhi]